MYRDPKLQVTQQFDWRVPRQYRPGRGCRSRAVRLRPAPRTVFAQWFPASATAQPGHVFPTLLQPTGAGCWRPTLQSGGAKGSLTVLFR